MLNAKFLLLSSAVAAGVWGVSYGSNQWLVLIQVVCAVVVSLSIFLAVLMVSETQTPPDSRSNAAEPLHYRNRFVASGHALPPQG